MKKCRCGLVCINFFCGLTGQFHCSLHIFWRFVWLAFAGKSGRFEGHEIYVNSFLSSVRSKRNFSRSFNGKNTWFGVIRLFDSPSFGLKGTNCHNFEYWAIDKRINWLTPESNFRILFSVYVLVFAPPLFCHRKSLNNIVRWATLTRLRISYLRAPYQE